MTRSLEQHGPFANQAGANSRIQRKSRFFALKGYGDREKSLTISAACERNSLLSGSMGDQWNFFADQRIKAALSTE
jgi:hypothetical protein